MKYALIEMVDRGDFDVLNPFHLFASSTVGCAVVCIAMKRFVETWNNHSIPRRGVPLHFLAGRGNYELPAGAMLSAEAAVAMYTAQGGNLVDESTFGEDPLRDDPGDERRALCDVLGRG